MFTIKLFYDDPLSRIEKSLYAGFHRFGWSLAVSWVVTVSVLGYAGPIKRLLCCRMLATISRLTYCAYLMNGVVELYLSSSIRTPSYMSTISLVSEHTLFVCIPDLRACLILDGKCIVSYSDNVFWCIGFVFGIRVTDTWNWENFTENWYVCTYG